MREIMERAPQEETLQVLDMCRERIDEIDGAIAELLAERLRVSEIAGTAKREIGLPIYDGARETEVTDGFVTKCEELGVDRKLAMGIISSAVLACRERQSQDK